MKKKKGVALIIVIVLILLFSAIILSVVLTSTTAYRRSTYFRDRNIAFNLAQIGIADALYKLNYRYHDPDHYYGFRSDGECLLLSDLSSLPGGTIHNGDTFSYRIKASEIGIFPASINDEAIVQIFISDGTYYDTIVSTGKFRGRTVKVSANIRTRSDETTNLNLALADNTNSDTKGIPEAFNKHVIYASSVTGSGTIVKGNIATESSKPSPWPGTWTDATWIQTSISLPGPSLPSLPSETNPPDPPPFGWVEFQMRGQPRYRIDGGSWTTPLPAGVSYSSDGTGTETFTFTTYVPPGNRKIYVRKSLLPPGRSGGACFNGATVVNSVLADGNIVFKNNITLSSAALFKADSNNDGVGTIIIHPNTTFNDSNLIVDVAEGNGSITINQANITINGALCTKCSLTIGTSATNLTIDASSSNMNAAIIVDSSANTTFALNNTPNIILGDNQSYAFLLAVRDSNPLTVNIATNGNVDFTANPIQNLDDKALFVAYSDGSNSTINIGSASRYAKILGLVFSYGATSGNITINNTNTLINGCLVANGQVNLAGGNLTYNGDTFKSDSSNIYKGFTGGRRIYLPLNWRIIW